MSSDHDWPNQLNFTYGDLREAVLVNLSVYTNYSIVVSAVTSCVETPSEIVEGRTNEDFPEAPRVNVSAELPKSVTIRWDPPAPPNGLITHYNVSH